jgi:hypothetical protein
MLMAYDPQFRSGRDRRLPVWLNFKHRKELRYDCGPVTEQPAPSFPHRAANQLCRDIQL